MMFEEKRLANQPLIIDIQSKLTKLQDFQKCCEENHQSHIKRDVEHDNFYNQHEQLLKTVIETQNNMVKSVQATSESLGVLSSFVNKHEPVLELIVSIVTGLKGFKKLILGLAAIVTAVGVIVGAGITVWSLTNTSLIEVLLAIKG